MPRLVSNTRSVTADRERADRGPGEVEAAATGVDLGVEVDAHVGVQRELPVVAVGAEPCTPAIDVGPDVERLRTLVHGGRAAAEIARAKLPGRPIDGRHDELPAGERQVHGRGADIRDGHDGPAQDEACERRRDQRPDDRETRPPEEQPDAERDDGERPESQRLADGVKSAVRWIMVMSLLCIEGRTFGRVDREGSRCPERYGAGVTQPSQPAGVIWVGLTPGETCRDRDRNTLADQGAEPTGASATPSKAIRLDGAVTPFWSPTVSARCGRRGGSRSAEVERETRFELATFCLGSRRSAD